MDAHEKKTLVEQWYYQYAKYLFHTAYMLGPKNQAEEILQETFRIVLEKDNLDEIEYPKTWLRKILYNVIRNRLRLLSNQDCSFENEERTITIPKLSYTDSIDIELEYDGIISAEELHILKLAYIEGFTYAEIACSLGITERACQKRVERAKNKLKKYLKDDKN